MVKKRARVARAIKHVADDEGSNKEGGKGDDNGDKGGGQAMAMATKVVGEEEGKD